MVNKLWQKLATLLGRTQSKHDTIELLVTNGQGINYMQSFMLSLEEGLTPAMGERYMSLATTGEDGWQKLARAGLVHVLSEPQELEELSIPHQMELDFTTSEKSSG